MSTHYSTTDIEFASYLKAKGYRIVDIETQGKQKIFVFDKKPSDKELFEFFNGEAVISARKLLDAYSSLKALTFVQKEVRR